MNRSKSTQKGNFNKRSNKKFSKREIPKDREEPISRKCNDPEWYIREGQLAKDVASFSFNNALGNAIELNVDSMSNTGISGKRLNMPGIMRIHTAPSVGYSSDGSSPINLAAKNLYSWVRHANSGHSNYDSPDLMLYLVAMDSIYALIWHFQRAYGTARVYSQKNRYIGDALITAMGFIPSELRANLANFRAYINMLIVKASAFCTPTTMSLFKRHTWMYSGIYKDEDIEKSQMYLYVPDVLYMYNENAGAGKCDPIACCATDLDAGGRMAAATRTLSAWYAIGDAMIARLVASEDINIMSGDIRKAYGDNIWQIALVPEDHVVVPIFSDEILDQIHNTVFTGYYPRKVDDTTVESQFTTYTLDSLTIYQDVLAPLEPIVYKPQFINGSHMSIEHILDMAENDPSPERVLVATRNMTHAITKKYTFSGNSYWLSELDSCGSDICFYADVMDYSSGGSMNYTIFYGYDMQTPDLERYTKFHKAPLVYYFALSAGSRGLSNVYGELGDFLPIDFSDIDKVHQSAILSMLGVPV